MEPVVVGAGEHGSHVGHAPVVDQALGLGVHDLHQHVPPDDAFGGDPLAPGVEQVHLGGLLVRGQVGFKVEAPDGRLVLLQDPVAGGEGGSADHVLARRVAGLEVEAEEGELAGQVGVDVGQLATSGGSLGFPPDLVQVVLDPPPEGQGLPRAVEDEHRGALHVVALDRAGHTAGQVEDLHPPVVGGHQGALGGGQGDQELALGVFAPDMQRPRESQRDLGHTGEVFDVALGHPGIEGILADVMKLHSGQVLYEGLPGRDDGWGVVVLLGTGHRGRLCPGKAHAVLHLEAEGAQALHLQGDLDGVGAFLDFLPRGPEMGDLLQGEGAGPFQGDLVGAVPAAVPEIHLEVIGPQFQGPDPHLQEPVEDQVAQSVLEADGHAVGFVPQRTMGIEVPKYRWRNHLVATPDGEPQMYAA